MRIKLLILAILLAFLRVEPVFAVSVSISNTPDSITDQSFNIDVAISGAQPGTNYLRANLFPTGTTKYFGYTYNGSSFVNASDYSAYLPVTIDSSGVWAGTVQAKLDPDSSYFSGQGNYSLKVRRYTQSGSSYTWSNEVTLNIESATPAPSPTATAAPIPAASAAPTSTSKPKSTTSTISSTATPKPSSAVTSIPQIQIVTPGKNNSESNPSVAGIAIQATPSASAEVKGSRQFNLLPWLGGILVIGGISSLGFVYLRSRKKYEGV